MHSNAKTVSALSQLSLLTSVRVKCTLTHRIQRGSFPIRGRRLFKYCRRVALRASVSGTLFSLSHSAQVYDQLSAGHGASRRRFFAPCSAIDVGSASTVFMKLQWPGLRKISINLS
jgi:hypothetical protein